MDVLEPFRNRVVTNKVQPCFIFQYVLESEKTLVTKWNYLCFGFVTRLARGLGLLKPLCNKRNIRAEGEKR
jgi:hypothetical protein